MAPANEMNGILRLFEHWDHRERRASRAPANHGDDLVLFDQAGGESARIVGVAAVVVNDQLQLLAVHAAFGVDFINIDFQRLLFWIAEKRRRSAYRQDGAYFDLSGCLVAGTEQGKSSQQQWSR